MSMISLQPSPFAECPVSVSVCVCSSKVIALRRGFLGISSLSADAPLPESARGILGDCSALWDGIGLDMAPSKKS